MYIPNWQVITSWAGIKPQQKLQCIFLHNMADSFKVEKTCRFCHKRASKFWCIECTDCLCATCGPNHKKLRGQANHSLVEMATVVAAKKRQNGSRGPASWQFPEGCVYSLGVRNQGRGATVKQNGRHACAVRAPSLESRQSFEGDRGPLQGEVNSGEECHGPSSLWAYLGQERRSSSVWGVRGVGALDCSKPEPFLQRLRSDVGKNLACNKESSGVVGEIRNVATTSLHHTHAGDAKLPEVFLDVHQVMDEEVQDIPMSSLE